MSENLIKQAQAEGFGTFAAKLEEFMQPYVGINGRLRPVPLVERSEDDTKKIDDAVSNVMSNIDDQQKLEYFKQVAIQYSEFNKFLQDNAKIINQIGPKVGIANIAVLADRMITPVQRPLRYPLLLDDLEKTIGANEENIANLDGSLKKIADLKKDVKAFSESINAAVTEEDTKRLDPKRVAFNALRDNIVNELEKLANDTKTKLENSERQSLRETCKNIYNIQYKQDKNGKDIDVTANYIALQAELNNTRMYARSSNRINKMMFRQNPMEKVMNQIDRSIAKSELNADVVKEGKKEAAKEAVNQDLLNRIFGPEASRPKKAAETKKQNQKQEQEIERPKMR
jgi:hypothetical protein